MQLQQLLRRAAGLSLMALLAVSPWSALADETPNTLTESEKSAGWKLLFDGKTTTGWHSFKKSTFPQKGWSIEDGWLHGEGKHGGDVVTEKLYDNFDLEWDWKLVAAGNSGLKYFVIDSRRDALGHEYQMLDDNAHPDAKLGDGKRVTASFYDVLKPTKKTTLKPPGEVNHSRILVKGNHVEHWLNGEKVLEYESGSKEVKEAIALSKFKNVEGFENHVHGHILLQDHDSPVWFRNIKIHELSN